MSEKGTKRKKVLKDPLLWLPGSSEEAVPHDRDLHRFS